MLLNVNEKDLSIKCDITNEKNLLNNIIYNTTKHHTLNEHSKKYLKDLLNNKTLLMNYLQVFHGWIESINLINQYGQFIDVYFKNFNHLLFIDTIPLNILFSLATYYQLPYQILDVNQFIGHDKYKLSTLKQSISQIPTFIAKQDVNFIYELLLKNDYFLNLSAMFNLHLDKEIYAYQPYFSLSINENGFFNFDNSNFFSSLKQLLIKLIDTLISNKILNDEDKTTILSYQSTKYNVEWNDDNENLNYENYFVNHYVRLDDFIAELSILYLKQSLNKQETIKVEFEA